MTGKREKEIADMLAKSRKALEGVTEEAMAQMDPTARAYFILAETMEKRSKAFEKFLEGKGSEFGREFQNKLKSVMDDAKGANLKQLKNQRERLKNIRKVLDAQDTNLTQEERDVLTANIADVQSRVDKDIRGKGTGLLEAGREKIQDRIGTGGMAGLLGGMMGGNPILAFMGKSIGDLVDVLAEERKSEREAHQQEMLELREVLKEENERLIEELEEQATKDDEILEELLTVQERVRSYTEDLVDKKEEELMMKRTQERRDAAREKIDRLKASTPGASVEADEGHGFFKALAVYFRKFIGRIITGVASLFGTTGILTIAIVGLFSGIFEYIQRNWTLLTEGLFDGFFAKVGDIMDWFSRQWESFNIGLDAIKNWIGKTWDSISNLHNLIEEKIGDFIDRLLNLPANIAAAIISALGLGTGKAKAFSDSALGLLPGGPEGFQKGLRVLSGREQSEKAEEAERQKLLAEIEDRRIQKKIADNTEKIADESKKTNETLEDEFEETRNERKTTGASDRDRFWRILGQLTGDITPEGRQGPARADRRSDRRDARIARARARQTPSEASERILTDAKKATGRTRKRTPDPITGPAAGMVMSPKGIDKLKQKEALRLEAYMPTPRDRPTIGWGNTFIDGKPVQMGMKITEEQAEQIFTSELDPFVRAVQEAVKVPVSQQQFDTLVSFAYNIGAQDFKRSTLVRKLNQGDFAGATLEFGRWVHQGGEVVPGLVNRREAEAQAFAADIGLGREMGSPNLQAAEFLNNPGAVQSPAPNIIVNSPSDPAATHLGRQSVGASPSVIGSTRNDEPVYYTSLKQCFGYSSF